MNVGSHPEQSFKSLEINRNEGRETAIRRRLSYAASTSRARATGAERVARILKKKVDQSTLLIAAQARRAFHRQVFE